MKRLRGCDLSACQSAIDDATAKAMVAAGIDFVYLRCAIGNEHGVDIRFKSFVEVLTAHGIVVGRYYFLYLIPNIDAREQARMHHATAEGIALGLGFLAPAADLEWPPRETRLKDGSIEQTWKKWGCSDSQVRDYTMTYLDEQERLTGMKLPAYSFRYFIGPCAHYELVPELGEHPLWLADGTYQGIVPDDDQLARLKPPGPWEEIAIVQHDGNGGLRLPNGVDADFNAMPGGQDALDALTRTPLVAGDVGAVATAAIAGTATVMTDDAIAAYRRDRIDEALLPEDAPITNE